MRYLTVFSIGALGILLAQTGDARAETAMRKVSSQFFIENRGQWHPDVLYLYRGGGMDAWITRDGVVYDFYRYREAEVLPPLAMRAPELRHGKFDEVPKVRYGHVVRLRHVGGNRSPQPVGQDRQPGYYNFLGSDPTRWVAEVPLYREVEVREVYPGIHQRWYFDGGWLRYDYTVSPGVDASQLRFVVEGADWVRAEGDKLVLGTRFGAVEQAGLYVYQGRERISAQWVVEGSEVSIAVGSYDRTQPLIIDPLVWSTFLGGVVWMKPIPLRWMGVGRCM